MKEKNNMFCGKCGNIVSSTYEKFCSNCDAVFPAGAIYLTIEKTLRARHKKLLNYVNDIWKLEKKKAEFRELLLTINPRKKDFDNITPILSPDPESPDTNIPVFSYSEISNLSVEGLSAEERLENINRDIEKIREKQREELDKIKSIIEI